MPTDVLFILLIAAVLFIAGVAMMVLNKRHDKEREKHNIRRLLEEQQAVKERQRKLREMGRR